MNTTQYSSLLATITILEQRFQSYLSDTPTTVVQGNRGALKSAMTETLKAFNDVETPEGVDYEEVVRNALASLVPKPEAPKTLGDDAVTSGKGGFNQDGTPIKPEVEEIEKTEKVEEIVETEQIENVDTDNEGKKDEEELENVDTTTDAPEMFDRFFVKQLYDIALVAYHANRAYCIELEEENIPSEIAPPEILTSVVRGIEFLILNPDTTPEQSHEAWVAYKTEQGYVYGEVKDLEAKTHPCLVPYAELSEASQHKDEIFLTTARIEIAKLDEQSSNSQE